jgi:integrase
MARRAEGWQLRRDERHGTYYVRFRIEGDRKNISTRTTDRREALSRAAAIYAEAFSGRRAKARPRSRESLTQLFADWIDDREHAIDEDTANEHERYASATLIPFFGSLDRITEAGAEDYARARLAKVTRPTVLKELSALRMFTKWCKTRGHIAALPDLPNPPVKSTGKSASPKVRVDVTPDQVEAFIAALPERTTHGKHPARLFARFVWETSLRYATVASVAAPGDYRRGDDSLLIRPECDKSRYGRRVPLSQGARDAADEVAPDVGLLFGPMNLRAAWRTAALEIGIPEDLAGHLSPHDLRHARITLWANTTSDLTGIAFLAGHKSVTTTALYVHSKEEAARRVLDAIGTSHRVERRDSGRGPRGRKPR